MSHPRPLGSSRHRWLAGGLFAVVLVVLAGVAWQLARSEGEGRAALRDRFADRAPVATSVVNALLDTAFTQQSRALGPRLGAPHVPRATLDALNRQNKALSATVLDARGRVVGVSRGAPHRRGFAPFERVALRTGHSLSPVHPGATPTITSATRLRTPGGIRLLVTTSPAKALTTFLGGTLKPLVGAKGGGAALVLDGRGRPIAAVGRAGGLARALQREQVTRGRGELELRGGRRFYASSRIEGSDWRTVVAVPTATLYGPAGGVGKWLPWGILGLLVLLLLGGVVLILRLLETGRRLAGANASLESANEDLERSNADLEQFAYVASHDLSSPLRSVSSFSRMLSNRHAGRQDPEADRWAGFIEDGVDRLQRIIDDLLRYSRVNQAALHPEPVDLTEVMEEVERALAPVLEERGASLTCEALPTVLAEPTHVSQVLQNLVVNATTYVAPGVEPRVHVSAASEGTMCRVSVTDNGIGVEPEHVERIFKMFQRLHDQREHPGSGIGLAISKRIVERHGGRMDVETHPEGGSTFSFTVASATPAARPLEGAVG
jgi:signal transduction histidine kinase